MMQYTHTLHVHVLDATTASYLAEQFCAQDAERWKTQSANFADRIALVLGLPMNSNSDSFSSFLEPFACSIEAYALLRAVSNETCMGPATMICGLARFTTEVRAYVFVVICQIFHSHCSCILRM